jgi:hypothetical protein
MSCLVAGYYVPLSTLAEVREQVLQYIPVMARPLVLTKTEHPINWTPVYADITVSRIVYIGLKNCVFGNGSNNDQCLLSAVTLKMEGYIPLKLWFLLEPHSVISEKTFIISE